MARTAMRAERRVDDRQGRGALSMLWRRCSARLGSSGWLLFGTASSGVAAYAFQILTGRVLGPARFASLGALWTVAFLLGPACFSPMEQELSRQIRARMVQRLGTAPAVRRHAAVGLAFAGLLAIIIGAVTSLLLQRAFDGHLLLLVSLWMALAGYYVMHLTWGVLAGAGHFKGYGLVTATEGIARFVLCAAIALGGVRSAGPFGLAIGLAPFVAAGVGWRFDRVTLEPGPCEPWSPTAKAVGALLIGSVLSQALLSVAPLTVKLLASPSQQAVAGAFQAGITLTRAPLFLFNALLVALIPTLTTLATTQRWEELRRLIWRVSLIVGMCMAAVTIGAAAIGPRVLGDVFGRGFVLASGDLALLGAACGFFMVASVLICGLISIGRHGLRAGTAGLACGSFLGVVVLGAPLGLVGRVAWGFAAGTLTMAVSSWLFYRAALRKAAPSLDPATTAGIDAW